MRAKVTVIAIALWLFHVATEIHSLISPAIALQELDLFFSAIYKRMLTIQWYLKMSFDDVLLIFTYFFAAWLSGKYSKRLFMIVTQWFFFHLADLWMFWWNYKSSYWTYYSLLIGAALTTILLVIPIKERARVVSME